MRELTNNRVAKIDREEVWAVDPLVQPDAHFLSPDAGVSSGAQSPAILTGVSHLPSSTSSGRSCPPPALLPLSGDSDLFPPVPAI